MSRSSAAGISPRMPVNTRFSLGWPDTRMEVEFASCKRLRSRSVRADLTSRLRTLDAKGDDAYLAHALSGFVRGLVDLSLTSNSDVATVLDCAVLSWVVARSFERVDARACESHINDVLLLVHRVDWRKLRTSLGGCRFSSARSMAKHYTRVLFRRLYMEMSSAPKASCLELQGEAETCGVAGSDAPGAVRPSQ